MLKYNGNGAGATAVRRNVTGRNIAHGKRTKAERLQLGIDLVLGNVDLHKLTSKTAAKLVGVPVLELRLARRQVQAGKKLQSPAPEVSLVSGFNDWWRNATVKAREAFALAAIEHIHS
jgi:hypothetical protein